MNSLTQFECPALLLFVAAALFQTVACTGTITHHRP